MKTYKGTFGGYQARVTDGKDTLIVKTSMGVRGFGYPATMFFDGRIRKADTKKTKYT